MAREEAGVEATQGYAEQRDRGTVAQVHDRIAAAIRGRARHDGRRIVGHSVDRDPVT